MNGPERAREHLRQVVGVLVHERAADHRVTAARVAELRREVDHVRAGLARGRDGGVGAQRVPAWDRARPGERPVVRHPAAHAVLGPDVLRRGVADDDDRRHGARQRRPAPLVALAPRLEARLARRGPDELAPLAGREDRVDLRVRAQPREHVRVPLAARLVERRAGAGRRRREHAQRPGDVEHAPAAPLGQHRQRRAPVLGVAVADQRDGRGRPLRRRAERALRRRGVILRFVHGKFGFSSASSGVGVTRRARRGLTQRCCGSRAAAPKQRGAGAGARGERTPASARSRQRERSAARPGAAAPGRGRRGAFHARLRRAATSRLMPARRRGTASGSSRAGA